MSFPIGCTRLFAASIATCTAVVTTEAAAVQAEHVAVDLISESGAFVPGQTAWLGLHLRHDPHWHSYWINPGDSGLPTKLKWNLPDGYAADAIIWPAPSRFEVSGLYNFGYDGEIVLPVAIRVPQSAIPGQSAALSVDASWLVCREECITGKATLELELPIAAGAKSPHGASANLFASARNATPVAARWSGRAVLDGDRIRIRITGTELPVIEGLDVFAVERRMLGNAPAEFQRDGDSLVIVARKNDYFERAPANLDLVLTSRVTNGRSGAWQLAVPFVVEESPD